MDLTFWTNILSPHQAAYIREVASAHNVTVVADTRLTADREALGWKTPNCGRANVLVGPYRRTVLKLTNGCAGTVHLVSGYRGCDMSGFVLRQTPLDARIGIIAECGDFRGLSGVLRKGRSRWDVWRNRSRVDFALAMGFLGETWWCECGLPMNRVFPFGYVVEKPGISELQSCGERPGFRLMYLVVPQ